MAEESLPLAQRPFLGRFSSPKPPTDAAFDGPAPATWSSLFVRADFALSFRPLTRPRQVHSRLMLRVGAPYNCANSALRHVREARPAFPRPLTTRGRKKRLRGPQHSSTRSTKALRGLAAPARSRPGAHSLVSATLASSLAWTTTTPLSPASKEQISLGRWRDPRLASIGRTGRIDPCFFALFPLSLSLLPLHSLLHPHTPLHVRPALSPGLRSLDVLAHPQNACRSLHSLNHPSQRPCQLAVNRDKEATY